MFSVSPRIRNFLLAGAGLTSMIAAAPAAQAQNAVEAGALPDLSLQSQTSTQRQLERLRFLAGGDTDGGAVLFGGINDNDFEFDAEGSYAGFTAENRGGLVGFQTAMGDAITVGAAVSRYTGDITQSSRGGGSFRDSALHAFSTLDLGLFQLGLNADYGRTKFENLHRAISVDPGSVTGDTKGSYWRLAATVGTEFELDNGTRIAPSLNYDYSHTVVNAFNESGVLGQTLNFERQSINARRLTAGVDFELPAWQITNGIDLVPVGDITYTRALSGENHRLVASGASAVNLNSPYAIDSGFNASIGAEARFDSG